MTDLLLLVHAGATWFMVGLIWFVQVVHYPLFGAVGRQDWPLYEHRHQQRTTLVVMPIMLLELASAVWLWILATQGQYPQQAWLASAGLLLLGGVWGSTFLVQVPLHARLLKSHSHTTVRLLVTTNWVRTVLWSARGFLVFLLLSGSTS